MAKRHIICTSFYDIEKEGWQEAFEEFCEINGLDESKEDIYDYIQNTLNEYFNDERINLNVPCGDILAIADLGLWDGRHSAYQIIRAGNLNGIFKIKLYDDYEFYCDQYNVKADIYHHDGCNHVTFYEIRPNKEAALNKLLEAIYNQEEVTPAMLHACTKSLRPYVKKVYGFK